MFDTSDPRLPPLPPERRAQNTAAADYLLSLGSEVSRRSMAASLQAVAPLVCRLPVGFKNLDGTPKAVLLEAVPWSSITPQLAGHARAALIDMRTRKGTQVSPATTNLRLAALRQVLIRAGNMNEAMRAATKRVAGNSIPSQGLELADFAGLLRAAGDDKKGLRDRAVLALLFSGLRRAEVSALDLEHFQKGDLLVYGKGRKWRRIPLQLGAVRALDAWLAVRGHHAGPLVQRLDKSGSLRGRLSTSGIYDLVREAGRSIGLKVHPHMGRSYAVSTMLDVGDLSAAQALVGHVDPKVTAGYNRRGWRQLAATVERMPWPSV